MWPTGPEALKGALHVAIKLYYKVHLNGGNLVRGPERF